MRRPRRILFVAPPIAPIGDGLGGGVETSLRLLTQELTRRGHDIGTVAVRGSRGLTGALFEVDGRCPASVTHVSRTHLDTMDSAGALEQMWERVSGLQDAYDLVLNTGYDWLSFYVPAFLRVPVLHWVSICSRKDAVDRMMAARYGEDPSRVAFYSRSQAGTFDFVRAETAHVLYGGVDTGVFGFDPAPQRRLCWSARISPEKGLEDALDACRELDLPLDVCGKIEDAAYWESLQPRMKSDVVRYRGFLSPPELSGVLGRSMAMLVSPKWDEAFGVSLIEAMSCGTPVVAYAGGGPSEIVRHGQSGYLVERGDIGALAEHALLARELDRNTVRARAAEFGVAALADRLERWIEACEPLATALGAD